MYLYSIKETEHNGKEPTVNITGPEKFETLFEEIFYREPKIFKIVADKYCQAGWQDIVLDQNQITFYN
jgi:hypothetical protein